jgi:hypothetical protein
VEQAQWELANGGNGRARSAAIRFAHCGIDLINTLPLQNAADVMNW